MAPKWFKRPAAASLVQTPRLGPTLFSFFRHGVLLLRLNFENGALIDDSNNYHALQHHSKVANIDELSSEGWQLRHILAMIYSACASREFAKTRMFQKHSEINELITFSGAVISGDHHEFGVGFVERPQSS